jgi:hypothetical protein
MEQISHEHDSHSMPSMSGVIRRPRILSRETRRASAPLQLFKLFSGCSPCNLVSGLGPIQSTNP